MNMYPLNMRFPGRDIIKKQLDSVDDILGQYREEFLEKQTDLIKSRVRLFCIFSVAAYVFSSFVWFLIDPRAFRPAEIPVGVVLIAGAVVIMRLNERARTLPTAKMNAYLFTAFLLLLLFKLSVFYSEDAGMMDSAYVFMLFLVTMTIPWLPYEVFFIGGMHFLAYTAFFLYMKFFTEVVPAPVFNLQQYFDGTAFMILSFILCLVVRKKEAVREAQDFILMKQVEEKNEQMRKELELAMRIHKTLVPGAISNSRVNIAVSYLPVYYIGGDYAKFHFLDENRLIFIISDVTGHGVSAALLVNRIHAEFERLAKENKEPGELLQELDAFIKDDFEGTDMYLSAFCGLLDFRKMRMVYSNHGHPPQCIYHMTDSVIQDLPAQTSMLGLPMESGLYQDEVKFSTGDRILLFTDGVTETCDNKGEEYGSGKLETFLKKNHFLPPDVFNHNLLEELNAFAGENKFHDDIFILHMEIKAHGGLFR